MECRRVPSASRAGLPSRAVRATGRSGPCCRGAPRPSAVDLADAPRILAALPTHPGARIFIPRMPVIGDGPDGGFDQFPATFVVERLTHRVRDEAATSPRTHPTVEFPNEGLLQRNVHTHGHTLAH